MHPLITKLAVPISGNVLVQSAIQKLIFSQFLHYLIGIGAGSTTLASGETVLFKLLRKNLEQQPLCIFDVGANRGQFLSLIQKHLHNLELDIHSLGGAEKS